MTEREYVEHIRKTAQAYLASVEGDFSASDAAAFRAWAEVKQHLSAEAAIAMCDVWLAGEGQGAPKASEGTDGA